jgi:hypothetical protein
LQRWFFSQINVGAVTVDFDSTVITRDGSQEGSAKGYNPNRKGRNSHHPLMAFISQTRMVANAWLRPGNTAACSNCVEFMRETFDEAMAGMKVGLVRGDSGFYTDEILSALEERSLNYIIAAKAYANLKNEIYGMKDWVEVCPGIAVKEWRHQPADPKAKARRHIVVRKQISRRPQAARQAALRGPARLPLQPVCDQPRPAAGSDLEHLQQPSGLREQDQGAQAGLRTRRVLPARLLGHGSLVPLHHGGLQPDEPVPALRAQQPQPGHLGDLALLLLCNRRLGQPARPQTSAQALPTPPKAPLDGLHLPHIEARPPPFAYSIA